MGRVDQICRKLFTRGINICQHAFFCLILRPLNCAFSKMLKSVKNTSKTTDFPKFRENKAKLSTVVNHDSKYRPRGQERKQNKKKNGKLFRLTFAFRIPDRSMNRRTFFFPCYTQCQARPTCTFTTYGARPGRF